MKKCPNGMYAEIKYDGERVQVHKQGDKFVFFSRSLKPVQPHKVCVWGGKWVGGQICVCVCVCVCVCMRVCVRACVCIALNCYGGSCDMRPKTSHCCLMGRNGTLFNNISLSVHDPNPFEVRAYFPFVLNQF